MGQSFVTLSQKEDSIGKFDDHIVEIFDTLEVDFDTKSFDISTPEHATETLKTINLMLAVLKRKKQILSVAKDSYSFTVNSDSEEINLSLF